MISAWKSQVAELEALAARYHQLEHQEKVQRQGLRRHVEVHWLRGQTLFWTAVTGWIWFSRRRDMETEDRGGLVAELLASFWIMQRWRRMTDRAATLARRAEQAATESPATAHPKRNAHHP